MSRRLLKGAVRIYGLPALLIGARLDEQAFAEGRGPDPFSFSIFDTAGLQRR